MYVVARRLGAVVAASLVGVLTAGCTGMVATEMPQGAPGPNGIGQMEPEQAFAAAAHAAVGLHDVVYRGKGDYPFLPPLLDVDARLRFVATADHTCSFAFRSHDMGNVLVRWVEGIMYVRADRTALRKVFGAKPGPAAAAAGRWGSQPIDEDAMPNCSVAGLSRAGLDGSLCFKEDQGRVDDVPTETFRCPDHAGTVPITVEIAAEGEPLVLHTLSPYQGFQYDLRLVDSDTGAEIHAPRRGQLINGDQYA